MAGTKIRALDRGLRVLQYLNVVKSALARDIAKEVGLPLPTVYRVFDTLARGGFVTRTADGNMYRLNIGVRRLSEGFTDEARVLAVGTPVLLRLRRKLVWPTELATFEHNAMVVRENTRRFTNAASERDRDEDRRPLLKDPLGLAYLAACPELERMEILAQLRHSPDPDDAVARNTALVEEVIARVDADGYASSIRLPPNRWASIAMPIRHDGRVLAAVNIRWVNSAFNTAANVAELLPMLRRMVAEIEEALDHASIEPGPGWLAGAPAPAEARAAVF